MPEQIYIGNFPYGQVTNRNAFNLDNTAFPYLFNFYSWRGRIKRKRGTILLDQMQIQELMSNATAVITGATQSNPCVITAANTFTPGQAVQIAGVGGMVQLNGNSYIVTAATAANFTINIDSTAFGAYAAGGTATLVNNWPLAPFNLVAGAGNLITPYAFQKNPTIVPGSISLTVGANVYTEPATPDGTLVGAPGGSGTINYATGAITIAGGGASLVTGTFSFYPGKVSLGQRDFVNKVESLYPLMISFDETNAYQVNQASGTEFYNVTYYKTTGVPFEWSGTDSQQFWTTNYEGAFWATNSKPGFNFVNGTYVAGASPGTSFTFNFTSGGVPFTTLIVGDKLWFNEWSAVGTTINGITGTVTNTAGSAAGNYVVTFTTPQTVIVGGGIAQLLTNTIPGQDGIKWYDGDPTNKTGLPTNSGLGWVNFAPPLTNLNISINECPTAKYYLIGALAIVPFKDRLLFFNPTIGTSSAAVGGGQRIQLEDTVIWSWNGTPYYTVSDTANTASVVPVNQTAVYFNTNLQPAAPYFLDQSGLGSWISAGIAQPIISVTNNEDVLLIGFGGAKGRKTRFVYSGNDIDPFRFFSINSELPSTSTFSAITLDKGAIDIGVYGITMTDQQSCQRIDLPIPDDVFKISNISDGFARVSAVRDFQKEWIYFSYPVNDSRWVYPTETFLFNYRDNTWAVLYENYTSRGTFRYESGFTWGTLPYVNWSQWIDPWGSGNQSAQFPVIVGGTPQGYVQVIGEGVGESPSATISDVFAFNATSTQIESFNHCLTEANPNTESGDYIYITGVLNLLSTPITGITLGNPTIITTANAFAVGGNVQISGVTGTTQLNGNVYEIVSTTPFTITIDVDSSLFTPYLGGGTASSYFNTTIGRVTEIIDADNFVVDIRPPVFAAGGYRGLGVFAKLSQPLLQTKQFNPYWDQGRQVRLSAQKYLLDATVNSQVTVNIFLSQDSSTDWNFGPIVPDPAPFNSSLVYSQIMYTCPESTNLGLTPANTNLQMPTASTQQQIWHRFNTSLIGDSVQVGITLSDAQMKNLNFATSEVTLHGIHLTVDRSSHLA